MGHRCKIISKYCNKQRHGAQKRNHSGLEPVIMKRAPRGKTGAAYTIPHIFYPLRCRKSSIILKNKANRQLFFGQRAEMTGAIGLTRDKWHDKILQSSRLVKFRVEGISIMKKYSVVFPISFLTYIFSYLAMPYMTAKIWADIIGLLFILACCFQLLYIIHLRKKENVTLGRSIGRYFLFLSFTAIAIVVISYGNIFVNGYAPSTWTGQQIGDTVYGFKAVINAGWSHFVCIPILFVSFVYQIGYYFISRKLKNKSA